MTKPENLASRRIESRRVVLGGAILAIIATVVVSTLTAGNPVSASTTRAAAVVGASSAATVSPTPGRGRNTRHPLVCGQLDGSVDPRGRPEQ
jgi:hypothetical protein